MQVARVKTIRDLRKLRLASESTCIKEFLHCTIKEVVVIVHYGRSGSYFLHSLLDNHPHLITMNSEFREFWKLPHNIFKRPVENQLIFILANWFACINSTKNYENTTDFDILNKAVHVPRDLLVNYQGSEFESLSDDVKKLKKPDLTTLVSNLYSLIEAKYGTNFKRVSLTRWQLFELFHLAWAASLNKSPQSNFNILFNAHVPDQKVIENLEIEKPITLIHTVRNPIQSLGSHLTRYLDPKLSKVFVEDKSSSILNVLTHAFEADTFLSERNRNQEFAIRLEDIHETPELTLRALMQRLKLPYHPCLLTEQFNGGHYGFVKGDTIINGFGGNQMSNNYETLFSQSDRHKLEQIFEINYQKWNYKLSPSRHDSDERISSEDLLKFDFLKPVFSGEDETVKSTLTRLYQKRLLRSKDDYFSVLTPKLSDNQSALQSGWVVWITGLSGSGKTTLAREFVNVLRNSRDQVVLFDGDELREVLSFNKSNDKLFSRQSRLNLAIQYSNLCKLISSQGVTVVIATISLFNEIHEWNRLNLPNYFEVYLDVPLEILRKRDPKGIYKNFDEKRLDQIVGLDLEFDTPISPDLIFKYAEGVSAESNALAMVREIRSRGYK